MQWALKYRPKTYDDVVGQRHIIQILKNLQRKDAIPSGMLFAGSRGTGKTTSARILAAALNCDSDSKPCGNCASCKSIQDGRSDSVLEIDAASHGLVEDVRELREMVRYSHTGKHRVVLMDEAHSASRAAFNALLKVLEEPPPNVLFILVTTEPSKILETVRSRLMPFEFRRLSVSEIEGRLQWIVGQENISINDQICMEIAKRVEGGMRDAVVMLEQLHYSDGGITILSFEELFGVVKDSIYVNLFNTIFVSDRVSAMAMIEEFFNKVGERELFLKGMLSFLKKVLVGLQGAEVDIEQDLMGLFSVPDTLACMRKVWDFMLKTQRFESFYSISAVMLYVEISEILVKDGGSVDSIPTKLVAPQSVSEFMRIRQKKGLL